MKKIAYIGKFKRMDDEEYIALGFEANKCKVLRIEETASMAEMYEKLTAFKPNLVLWAKLKIDDPAGLVAFCKKKKYKTACWVFDLYIGYHREFQLSGPAFKADYVFTTDGGHQEEFKKLGINHICVRQGIANSECYLETIDKWAAGVVFVGTDNPMNPYRIEMINEVKKFTTSFEWIGRGDPQEVRGPALNTLYSKKQIVIGDSVYSPHYWSNRVVETLGRGGFLIHPEVEGLKEEYPHLITYPRGSWIHLTNLISYYATHESERRELVRKNFEWVRQNYTVDKKCAELLSHLK